MFSRPGPAKCHSVETIRPRRGPERCRARAIKRLAAFRGWISLLSGWSRQSAADVRTRPDVLNPPAPTVRSPSVVYKISMGDWVRRSAAMCPMKKRVREMCRVNQQHARDHRHQWKVVTPYLTSFAAVGERPIRPRVRVPQIKIDHKRAKVPSLESGARPVVLGTSGARSAIQVIDFAGAP